MDKQKRKLNAWLRAHEEELMFFMKNPKKWEFCKKHIILPKTGPQGKRECSLDDLALLMKGETPDDIKAQ